MPELRTILAGCFALLLAAAAGAQSTILFDEEEVFVTLESPWPKELSQGYAPLRVRVDNRSEQARVATVEVNVRAWGIADGTVTRHVAVAAGASTSAEMYVPVLPRDWANYYLLVEVGDSDTHHAGVIEIDFPPRSTHAVVILTATTPPERTLLDWEEELEGVLSERLSLAAVPFVDAPRRMEGYSSLDALIIDTTSPAPAPLYEPILAWVRLGGTIAFLGPNAEAVAEAVPGVEPWMEERFLLETDGGGGHVWRIGHGRLLVEDAPLFLASAPSERLLDAAVDVGRAVPNPHVSRFTWPEIPGLDKLPYRTLILLLFLFAVVIGPVNFLVVKSSGRPSLLLVTIPLLALFAGSAVLAYGILFQGIDVKSAAVTHTVLDQRSHRADTLEVRTIFAGLSPGEGLEPGGGTIIFPEPLSDSDGLDVSYDINLDRGLSSGDYLPVRRPASQMIVVDRSARARIAWEADGATRRVTNGLGVTIQHLLVREFDGAWYRLDGTLGPDATAAVEAVDSIVAEGWRRRIAQEQRDRGEEDPLPPILSELSPLDRISELWRGGYIAVLDRNPFVDDCGVESNELAGAHVVFGILDDEVRGDPGEQGR